MNMYQKFAFGSAALIGLAWLVVRLYDQDGLSLMVLTMLGIAVLTLPVTWRLILTIVQAVSVIMATIGHVIGIIGDEAVDRCKAGKAWLNGNGSASRVPDWDSLELSRTESTDDLDVPSFVRSAMDHQNV